MFEATAYNQLDHAIDALIANPDSTPACTNPALAGMLELAAELRDLPRHGFRSRLKADLLAQAASMNGRRKKVGSADRVLTLPRRAAEPDVLPTLFGTGYGAYPPQRANFLASLLLHSAAIALILTSGLWMAGRKLAITRPELNATEIISDYVLPPAPDQAAGGGGGGDRDRLAASKGSAPRFAREQIAPPAIIIRNDHPRLPAEPTVVGPPSLVLPQMAMTGDPLSNVIGPPSNGSGSGGGIGSGSGGGVGSGYGPGVGPGWGGGIGGGVFKVGGGVSAPRAIYSPDPEYSDEARKAKYQGSVVLWLIIDQAGRPRQIKLARALGMGLDEKAIEAVRKWKFEPAMKDGRPVAVQVNVEVNFRLY